MKDVILRTLIVFILVVGSTLFSTAKQPGSVLTPMEELGKALFFDKIAAPDSMACANCHDPQMGWTGPIPGINKHGAVYRGAVPQRFGNRKPPSAAYATFSPTLDLDMTEGIFIGGNFWDGRATGEHLGNPSADQALGPFLNPVEQNNPSKQAVLEQIAMAGYASLWESVWGEPISYQTQADIDTNYDRVGLAIAEYEASSEVSQFTSKYDAYLAGTATLTAQETWGLELYEGKAKCTQCHPSDGSAPLFTDFTYDNLGVPKNPQNPFYEMDEVFLDDGTPINPLGDAWIDFGLGGFLSTHSDPDWAALAPENMGKQKVPTLRNVDLRQGDAPKAYMHNGVFKSLEEVVHFYNTRDVEAWPPPEVAANVNTDELGNLGLTEAEEDAIVAFLKTLSDGYQSSTAPIYHMRIQEVATHVPRFALFQNTPNPFNPETWIGFSLGRPSDVTLTIYDGMGRVVRRLGLGERSAGIYLGRARAAYWDGRNQVGESVGSGVYYYTLQAGEFIATRRMTILK